MVIPFTLLLINLSSFRCIFKNFQNNSTPHLKRYISLISSSETAASPSSGKLVTKRNSVLVSTSQKNTILCSEVGRKVESSCQQIIRAIFIFLIPSQQSTINSQQ